MQREEDPERENGRGLAIVDALTHRWGSVPRVIGKVVWFEIDLPGPPDVLRADSPTARANSRRAR